MQPHTTENNLYHYHRDLAIAQRAHARSKLLDADACDYVHDHERAAHFRSKAAVLIASAGRHDQRALTYDDRVTR